MSADHQAVLPGAFAEHSEKARQSLREDQDLSAAQLDDKYNEDGDGRHPVFTQDEWVNDVFNHTTLLGYWEWVVHQISDAE